MPSGATATFPDDVLLDTAILYHDVASVSTMLGASMGGLTFQPGTTWRNVAYDGQRAPVEGLDRITDYVPKITGSMVQAGPTLLGLVEPKSTAAFATPTRTVTPVVANTMLVTNDYLTNVKLVWSRSNGGTYAVVFPVALVLQYEVSGKDKGEAEVKLTIEARRAATALEGTCPYHIELTGPDITS